MYAQKLSFDYAHTVHTVRIVPNAYSVHRSRVQKGQSCDCINNIYGLDIDDRAAQLAYFAVMMKARQYDHRFFSRKDENGNLKVPQPHVHEIVESGYTGMPASM